MLLLALQTENILTVLDQLWTEETASFCKFSSISLEFHTGYSDSMNSLYMWDALKLLLMGGLRI